MTHCETKQKRYTWIKISTQNYSLRCSESLFFKLFSSSLRFCLKIRDNIHNWKQVRKEKKFVRGAFTAANLDRHFPHPEEHCPVNSHHEKVTGRFAHFPVRPESFRPESFRPRVVSPSITWVVSPSYPESFRPLLDESFRPLSKFIFYWGYCEKFTVFVSFKEDFVIFL